MWTAAATATYASKVGATVAAAGAGAATPSLTVQAATVENKHVMPLDVWNHCISQS